MKNTIQKFKLLPVLLALFSCGEEPDYTIHVVGDTENVVYINTMDQLATIPKNFMSANATVSWTSILSFTTTSINIPVYCSKPAEEDIIVTLGIANDYQTTGWNMTGASDWFEETQVTIPKGEMKASEGATLTVNNNLVPAGEANKLIFPVKITAVNGSTVLSSNSDLSHAGIGVNISFTNVQASTPSGTVQTKPTGSASWTATASASSFANPQNMFDASTATTSYTTVGTRMLPLSIDINMREVKTAIRGLRILYSSATYRFTNVSVYSQETATSEWVFQGRLDLGNATTHNIRFYDSINAQFIRLQGNSVQTLNNDSGVRITDFAIYQ